MHEYEYKLLSFLKDRKSSDVESICNGTGLGRDAVLWASESLKSKSAIEIKVDSGVDIEISPEALGYAEGFPEQALLSELRNGPKDISVDINSIALAWAKRNGWAEIRQGKLQITDKGRKAFGMEYDQEKVLKLLLSKTGGNGSNIAYISNEEMAKIEKTIKELEHRKLLQIKPKSKITSISITDIGIGMLSGANAGKGIGQLTRDAIKSRIWSDSGFRPYDVEAPVAESYPARRHPMKEFMELVRRMWVSQGFIETAGPMIESSFWNFDALFSPQDHPTREMQDTFFLSNPEIVGIAEKELLKRVARMHRKGWKSWNEDISFQPVLRTHTTSVSAHNISEYGNSSSLEYPIKLFSIGKVFRNESIDYKHLAELHQLDGIIIGKGLGVADLKGTLEQFYNRLGFKIKFKPSYFPFVEPGLEASYYDEEHGDWIELCGGGIIRKEITKALGTDMRVIAWGAGLDRLMFKYLGISSLSELYKNDIGWLRRRRPLKL
ncbi:MAG: phenylalanine--tRNA ligase subunit alpha [Methanothrix sp.]